MRVLYGVCAFIGCCLYVGVAESSISSLSENFSSVSFSKEAEEVAPDIDNLASMMNLELDKDTKITPLALSNPLFSARETLIKLATVYFITSESDIRNMKPGGTKDVTCKSGEVFYQGRCTASCAKGYSLSSNEVNRKKGKLDSESCNGSERFGYLSCNNGWTLNKQTKNCDEVSCDEYPLLSKTGCSTSVSKKCGENYHYSCTSCPVGFELRSLDSGKTCTEKPCDRQMFPYTEGAVPSYAAGTVVSCTDQSGTYYGYSSCNEGWDQNQGTCNAHSCDNSVYPLSSQPDTKAGSVISCKSEYTTKYGYENCYPGWTKVGTTCRANDCSSYTSTSSSIQGCSNVAECQSSTTTTYKCTACSAGWTLTGVTCKKNDCSSYTSNSATIANCNRVSSCQSDTTTKYKCEACASGYSLSGGTCKINDCSGYSSNSSSITGCNSTSSCQTGSTTKYKCTSCSSGYSLSGGTCKTNDCSGYPSSSSSISGCRTTASCQSGSSTKWKCTQCSSGYGLSGGTCSSTCNYTSTSKPTGCETAPSCTKNGTTYYANTCTTCSSCFDLNNGTCKSALRQYCPYYENGQYLGIIIHELGGLVLSGDRQKIAWSKTKPSDSLSTWKFLEDNSSAVNILDSNGGKIMMNAELMSDILIGMQEDNKNTFYAAEHCYNKTTGGKQWRLPGRDELKEFYYPNGWENEHSQLAFNRLESAFATYGGAKMDDGDLWGSYGDYWTASVVYDSYHRKVYANYMEKPFGYNYMTIYRSYDTTLDIVDYGVFYARCLFSYKSDWTRASRSTAKDIYHCIRDGGTWNYETSSCSGVIDQKEFNRCKTCGGQYDYSSNTCNMSVEQCQKKSTCTNHNGTWIESSMSCNLTKQELGCYIETNNDGQYSSDMCIRKGAWWYPDDKGYVGFVFEENSSTFKVMREGMGKDSFYVSEEMSYSDAQTALNTLGPDQYDCNDQSLCGAGKWRLPTLEELQTMYADSNSGYSNNIEEDGYIIWTSTSAGNGKRYAWNLDTNTSLVADESSEYYVYPVIEVNQYDLGERYKNF